MVYLIRKRSLKSTEGTTLKTNCYVKFADRIKAKDLTETLGPKKLMIETIWSPLLGNENELIQ